MDVMMVTNLYPPVVLGGYELLARDVVLALRDRGHRVRVMTTSGSAKDDPDACDELRLALPFNEKPYPARFRHWVARQHNQRVAQRVLSKQGIPEVALVMSQRRLGLGALQTLQANGVPLVLTVNDDWPVAFSKTSRNPGLASRLLEALDNSALGPPSMRSLEIEHVLYLSDSIRREVRSRCDTLPEGNVCSQGVDTSLFTRRVSAPNNSRLRLLFSGRLHPTKGPDVCIETLAKLRSLGVDAELWMAGAAADPSYERELKELAQREGVSNEVRWWGHVPRNELVSLYHECDVFLFLSRWDGEGQGLTYLEAMACGLPVVAHPRGGARDLLANQPVYKHVEACDATATANAVSSLVREPLEMAAMADRASAFLRTHANLDRYVDAIETMLLDASKHHRSRRVEGAA